MFFRMGRLFLTPGLSMGIDNIDYLSSTNFPVLAVMSVTWVTR